MLRELTVLLQMGCLRELLLYLVISIRYIRANEQVADMLTTWAFTVIPWKSLMRLIQNRSPQQHHIVSLQGCLPSRMPCGTLHINCNHHVPLNHCAETHEHSFKFFTFFVLALFDKLRGLSRSRGRCCVVDTTTRSRHERP